MNEKEHQLIISALKSSNPTNSVRRAGIKILTDRLQWDSQPDRQLRFLLENVVKNTQFEVEYKLLHAELSPDSNGKGFSLTNIIMFVVLVGLGLYFVSSESDILSLIGGLMCGIGGYGISRAYNKKKVDGTASPRLVVTTTASQIGEQIDAIYTSFTAFYKYRQLEGRQKDVLLWFQQLYRKTDSEDLRESISELLAQYGYSFEMFSEARSVDFELHGGNVEVPKTTVPAIINDEGLLICKGVAVIP